ncbi:MAG: NADH:ubiquinone reductase (Na(+)-transporting) subunit C [Cyclobacteriaceae bacterium]
MQRSNTYIILFAIGLTIVLGGALSLTSVGLKPLQDIQVELDTKKKILGAVMDISNIEDPEEILKMYSERVKSVVVDYEGNELTTDAKGNPYVAEKVNIQKNSKLDPKERAYPVFMFTENGEVEAYIFPTFGAGLWDWISSYVAFGKDLNTIKGIAFDHKGETPGLGARLTEPGVQGRFEGKKVFDQSNNLISVKMVKGEGNTGLSEHEVDGLSGATMTTKGVNVMLMKYLECYSAYIEKVKSQNS